jgi:hypothetical protein
MAEEGNAAGGTGAFPTPPYIAYRTLGTLVGDFKEHGLPPVIDRSVLTRFSGGVAGQIMSALSSLGLMDEKKRPTQDLADLVNDYETDDYKPRLRKLIEKNYPYVLKLNLETATPSMFADAFKNNLAAKEEVLRKCRTFFLQAARDVGIAIGPRIESAKFPRSRGNGGARKKRGTPTPTPVEERHDEGGGGGGGGGGKTQPNAEIVSQLLAKFPDFDPSWPDEIKAKWFAGFDQFMAGVKGNGG